MFLWIEIHEFYKIALRIKVWFGLDSNYKAPKYPTPKLQIPDLAKFD